MSERHFSLLQVPILDGPDRSSTLTESLDRRFRDQQGLRELRGPVRGLRGPRQTRNPEYRLGPGRRCSGLPRRHDWLYECGGRQVRLDDAASVLRLAEKNLAQHPLSLSHSRRLDRTLATSGPLQGTDINRPLRLVRFVPGTDIALFLLLQTCFTPQARPSGTPLQAIVPASRPYRTGSCRRFGGALPVCTILTQ